MTAATLFDAGEHVADAVGEQSRSIAERFATFHAEHPEVYRALVAMARKLVLREYDHLGIAMLWETLRYETMLGATPGAGEPYRLNNSYRALYARLIMETEPDLAGIFETRTRRS